MWMDVEQICVHTIWGDLLDPVNIEFTSRGRSLQICPIYFHMSYLLSLKQGEKQAICFSCLCL